MIENGSVAPFQGDLDDYRQLVLRGAQPRPDDGRKVEPRISRGDIRRAAADRRAELAPLRKRIAAAEKAITSYKDELARLDTLLAASGLFTRDARKAATLAKARAEAAHALKQAEEEWLAASDAYEAVTA